MIDTKWIRQLTPRDALRIIWKRKWLLVLPLILTTLAAYGGSQLLQPVYRSSVVIAVGNPVIISRDLQQLTGFSGNYMGTGGQDRGEAAKSLRNEITSTKFLSKLIYRMNLDSDPALEARVAKLTAGHPDWDPQAVKLDILSNDLKNRIQLDLIAANQIKIFAYASDPQKAKDLAENLGNIFMSEKKEQMMRMVYSSIDFSYEQLENYEKDLQDKIDRKNQLEEELLKLQVDGSYGSDEMRKQLNDEIQSTQTEIDNLKDEETESKVEVSDLLLNNGKLKDDSLITRKNSQLKEQYGNLADKLKTVSWKDPAVISLKDKTYKNEQDIDTEIKYLVESQYKDATPNQRNYLKQYFISRERMDVLYAKLNSLKLSMADLNKNITLIPEYQSKLDQIDREITAARNLRDQFKVQQEGYQISQKLLNQSRIDLIEEARVPFKPVSPNKNKLIVMGIILGLALGGATILMVELFDNSVKQIGWIEDDLNLKVIGTIPKVTWGDKAEKKSSRKTPAKK